jgi:hypothetical protein
LNQTSFTRNQEVFIAARIAEPEAAMARSLSVETKMVNALISDAEVSLIVGLLTWPEIALLKRYSGGLGVGGRVDLTQTQLIFQPNAANALAHKGGTSFAVPLDATSGISIEPGFLTDVIAIATPDRTHRIRCFGAKRFAERLRARTAQAR